MPKREEIEPHPGDKRYVRRDDEGRFTKALVAVGRYLSQVVRKPVKRKAGHGRKQNERQHHLTHPAGKREIRDEARRADDDRQRVGNRKEHSFLKTSERVSGSF